MYLNAEDDKNKKLLKRLQAHLKKQGLRMAHTVEKIIAEWLDNETKTNKGEQR